MLKKEGIATVAESGVVGEFISQSNYQKLGNNVMFGKELDEHQICDIQTFSRRKIRDKDVLMTVDYNVAGLFGTFEGFVFSQGTLYYISQEEISAEFNYGDITSIDIETGQYGVIIIND